MTGCIPEYITEKLTPFYEPVTVLPEKLPELSVVSNPLFHVRTISAACDSAVFYYWKLIILLE